MGLGGVAISIVFTAKTLSPVAAPAAVTVSIVFWLAEAKTSAGAFWVIWVARVLLAPKLNVTVAPGCAAS